jgi:hypothetical protein
METDFIKQAIFAFVRIFGGPIIAGISLKIGATESETTAVVVGALTAGILYIWSLFNKARYEKKIDIALDLPSSATRSTLKDVLENSDR